MELKEFIQFCSTNKKWRKFCDNENNWKHLYHRFGINLKDRYPDLSYIKLVQMLYKIKSITDASKINIPLLNFDRSIIKNFADRQISSSGIGRSQYTDISFSKFPQYWFLELSNNHSSDTFRISYEEVVNFLADCIYYHYIE